MEITLSWRIDIFDTGLSVHLRQIKIYSWDRYSTVHTLRSMEAYEIWQLNKHTGELYNLQN